jgi:hypothetical protein
VLAVAPLRALDPAAQHAMCVINEQDRSWNETWHHRVVGIEGSRIDHLSSHGLRALG